MMGRSPEKYPNFNKAVAAGDLEYVKKYIKKHKPNLNNHSSWWVYPEPDRHLGCDNFSGDSLPLCLAMANGNCKMIKLLLHHGASPQCHCRHNISLMTRLNRNRIPADTREKIMCIISQAIEDDCKNPPPVTSSWTVWEIISFISASCFRVKLFLLALVCILAFVLTIQTLWAMPKPTAYGSTKREATATLLETVKSIECISFMDCFKLKLSKLNPFIEMLPIEYRPTNVFQSSPPPACKYLNELPPYFNDLRSIMNGSIFIEKAIRLLPSLSSALHSKSVDIRAYSQFITNSQDQTFVQRIGDDAEEISSDLQGIGTRFAKEYTSLRILISKTVPRGIQDQGKDLEGKLLLWQSTEDRLLDLGNSTALWNPQSSVSLNPDAVMNEEGINLLLSKLVYIFERGRAELHNETNRLQDVERVLSAILPKLDALLKDLSRKDELKKTSQEEILRFIEDLFYPSGSNSDVAEEFVFKPPAPTIGDWVWARIGWDNSKRENLLEKEKKKQEKEYLDRLQKDEEIRQSRWTQKLRELENEADMYAQTLAELQMTQGLISYISKLFIAQIAKMKSLKEDIDRMSVNFAGVKIALNIAIQGNQNPGSCSQVWIKLLLDIYDYLRYVSTLKDFTALYEEWEKFPPIVQIDWIRNPQGVKEFGGIHVQEIQAELEEASHQIRLISQLTE